jgi:D-amino-acid oxidase
VFFKRAIFPHICDTAKVGVHHSGLAADLVVNCTGLSASKIGGVEDKTVVPARGQIVLVRNEAPAMYSISGTDDGEDETCYIMTRAVGGGTILGVCYQKGNWESQPDPNLATRIMKRAAELCPELTGGKGIEHLDVIRHGVGLRPVREGVRELRLRRSTASQSSYGCALEAVKLIDHALQLKAKL